jgi:hypothetical protein
VTLAEENCTRGSKYESQPGKALRGENRWDSAISRVIDYSVSELDGTAVEKS